MKDEKIQLHDKTFKPYIRHERILDAISDELGIGNGDTTQDGLFTLSVVSCLGCCSLAPVLSINGRVYGKLDRKSLTKILNEYKAKG